MSPWTQMQPELGGPPPGAAMYPQQMGPMPQQMPPPMPPMGQQDFVNTGGVGMHQQLEQEMNQQKSVMSDISLEQAQLKHAKDKLGMEVTLMQKLMGKLKEGM